MKQKWVGILTSLVMLVAVASAQNGYDRPARGENNHGNHAEVGAFMNYTRLHNAADADLYGLGGRIGFHLSRHVQLEAEGAYDFAQNVDVAVNAGGGTVTVTRSPLRIAHFLFGPKFQLGATSPLRLFVTLKGGLMNFSTDTNFGSQVTSIPTGETDAAFYPGGGIEFFTGWLGVRFEAGDEMYFDGGVHHNLRLTAGPVIRF